MKILLALLLSLPQARASEDLESVPAPSAVSDPSPSDPSLSVFAGQWLLDLRASDPPPLLPGLDADPVRRDAPGGPDQDRDELGAGRAGAGMGDSDDRSGIPRGLNSASAAALNRTHLAILLKGSIGLKIAAAGSADDASLDMGWWDGCHIEAVVDGKKAHSQDSLLGIITTRASWVGASLQVERKLGSLRIRETLLPPDEQGELISVVEIWGTGVPDGLTQRRVYKRDPQAD